MSGPEGRETRENDRMGKTPTYLTFFVAVSLMIAFQSGAFDGLSKNLTQANIFGFLSKDPGNLEENTKNVATVANNVITPDQVTTTYEDEGIGNQLGGIVLAELVLKKIFPRKSSSEISNKVTVMKQRHDLKGRGGKSDINQFEAAESLLKHYQIDSKTLESCEQLIRFDIEGIFTTQASFIRYISRPVFKDLSEKTKGIVYAYFLATQSSDDPYHRPGLFALYAGVDIADIMLPYELRNPASILGSISAIDEEVLLKKMKEILTSDRYAGERAKEFASQFKSFATDGGVQQLIYKMEAGDFTTREHFMDFLTDPGISELSIEHKKFILAYLLIKAKLDDTYTEFPLVYYIMNHTG